MIQVWSFSGELGFDGLEFFASVRSINSAKLGVWWEHFSVQFWSTNSVRVGLMVGEHSAWVEIWRINFAGLG